MSARQRERAAELAGRVGALALVLYLALKGGGYDAVVRSEVGILVWWAILMAMIAGMVAGARIGRIGWAALALLTAFAVWTGVGIAWSESAERSTAELARVAVYAGILALALLARGRVGARPILEGVASGVALACALAVLSRLKPGWFPANETAEFLPGTTRRLSYPLNYWNGLAAFAALALPLLVHFAASGRTLAGRACAAAALPVTGLAMFLTFSRAGALAAIVAVVTLLLAGPGRPARLWILVLGGGSTATLIVGAMQRPAVENGVVAGSAQGQGDEMLAMVLLVAAGAALVHTGVTLLTRGWAVAGVGRRRHRLVPAAMAAILALGLAGWLVAGGTGYVGDRLEEFKNPGTGVAPGQAIASRFGSTSGNGRYQYWEAALDANATRPLAGRGAGTYEFWWAREGSIPSYVRDAHSLYFEVLAELGLIGLALILSLFALVLASGVWRVATTRGSGRELLAAATASAAAFTTSAAFDWVWELAVIPATYLIVAATLLGPRRRERPSNVPPRVLGRLGLAGLSICGTLAIAIPLGATAAVRDSQREAGARRIAEALGSADDAQAIQPYAATPALQRALVLELDGRPARAAKAAADATRREPTNWRTWLVRSRVEAQRGGAGAAVESYRRARDLNPRSPIFNVR